MAFLSQASHLGSLLPPHDAFQEHAAHLVEWPAKLSSKGSERTCIRSGLTTFLHCTFTAHPDLVVKSETIAKIPGFDMATGKPLSYSFGPNLYARRPKQCSVRVRIDPILPKGSPRLPT